MAEIDLQEFLRTHPYLIDEKFDGVLPAKQLRRGRNRLDLLFELRTGAVIVELKKTVVKPDDVVQLLRYCRIWSPARRLLRTHYLVGHRPSDLAPLEAAVAESSFRIAFRFLGHDIPLSVQFDEKTRRYERFHEGRPHLKVWHLPI